MFDPKTDKFPYPEYTDQHYLKVHKNNGEVFDDKYPYIDNSKAFLKKVKMVRFLLRIIVFPFTKIRLGLKIKNKENLKKYKDVIEKGVISVSNHVHMFDYLSIMCAIKPIKPYVLVWAPNVRGESGSLVRKVGGIPIPDNDMKGTLKYVETIDSLLTKGGWLHIYSEGSMWEYYSPIRPFKRGAAYFAKKDDKPIIPLAFSYRKPGWIRRHIFHQIAKFTLTIGEPIYINKLLDDFEQEIDLTIRSHAAVCSLAGINPKDNLYSPLYNHSRRVDYYTSIYGVGYKGSH